MESLTNLTLRHHQPLHLSFNLSRPSPPLPISTFRPLPSLKIRATSLSSQSPQNPKPSFLQTLTPLASTFVAAAALFTLQFHLTKPALASPISTAAANLTNPSDEFLIEHHLTLNPNDVDALRSLVKLKIKTHKLAEAIEVLDRLIEAEPVDSEWQLLKANLYTYMNENDLAADEFEDILRKHPLRVEAYHGLVMSSPKKKLGIVLRRVEKAMAECRKKGRKSDARDFKLLIAQIRVVESEYKGALELYEELVKEEPRDFRPYLCQGIIYSLLKKKSEAEKQFATFRKLVPKNHPYKEYFDDNMFATTLFGANVEREAAEANV